MMKASSNIALLGSTGSIGRQSLEVMEALNLRPAALTAYKNIDLLEAQARKFKPVLVSLYDEQAAKDLKIRLSDTPVRVEAGPEGLLSAATLKEADTALISVVGIAGLAPTLAAIEAGKRIALANKETLVCAGELVMRSAAQRGVRILPVDSEHSAIFQCLEACHDRTQLKRLILTASGGPFFGKTTQQLQNVSVQDALRHPNWSMGSKITIDSATLMNKGLELIEAMWLFDISPEDITIVVHRESIIHSMVEFCDNAVLAQMGTPDMRLPIQYALTWPDRRPCAVGALDFSTLEKLTFHQPDRVTFTCLESAMSAAKAGGVHCAVLNGANEAAVELFLREKISFLRIGELVRLALEAAPIVKKPGLDDIFQADAFAREFVYSKVN